MSPISNLDEIDDTARLILDAASRRFLHYGYGKTTMQEIAKDCNMSTGNLYRYFPAKMDIAETFVHLLRREQTEMLQEFVNSPDLTPEERLRGYLHKKFDIVFDRFHNRPKAYELSHVILAERPQVGAEWEKAEAALIVAILEIGEKEGVIHLTDKEKMARTIQSAVFRFIAPTTFLEAEYELLVSDLDDVILLILDAFSWRSAHPERCYAADDPTYKTSH